MSYMRDKCFDLIEKGIIDRNELAKRLGISVGLASSYKFKYQRFTGRKLPRIKSYYCFICGFVIEKGKSRRLCGHLIHKSCIPRVRKEKLQLIYNIRNKMIKKAPIRWVR